MTFRMGALAAMLAVAGLTAGCQTMDVGGMVGAGGKAIQAFNLSDQEAIALSDQSCKQMDAENKVASPNSKYNKRLQRVVKPLTKQLNGQTPNFKVYQTQEVNAWATARKPCKPPTVCPLLVTLLPLPVTVWLLS